MPNGIFFKPWNKSTLSTPSAYVYLINMCFQFTTDTIKQMLRCRNLGPSYDGNTFESY